MFPDQACEAGEAVPGRPYFQCVARTKRQRKLDERRQREAEREVARRVADGQKPVVVLIGPDTKVRRSTPVIGKPVACDSDYAKRLAKAPAFLRLPY
jgi:hypothetical protein